MSTLNTTNKIERYNPGCPAFLATCLIHTVKLQKNIRTKQDALPNKKYPLNFSSKPKTYIANQDIRDTLKPYFPIHTSVPNIQHK